jgi:Tfp pilus assembly protein PilN
MLEVNLLPGGSRKKVASGGPSLDFKAILAGVNARMGDKLLISCVAIMVVAAGAGAYLYYKAGADRETAEHRVEVAKADSVRFAKVVAERNALEAKRDTLLRQVNLIRTIDDDRYVWPHIMDEVSRALPPFTWITIMTFAGNPAGAANVVASPAVPVRKPTDTTAAARAAARAAPALPTAIPRDQISVKIIGRTVDIQAMTQFVADLEASPFLGNVYNQGATPASEGAGGDFFQFQLTLNYTRPDSTILKRVPLVATPH